MDDAAGVLVHAAGLSRQHSLHLGVGNGQPHIPADLFFHLIDAADHPQLQAPAGGGVGNIVVQPHEIHRPAADVHEQDGWLVLEEFRVDHQGGIPLWKQLHILDGHFVGDALELEAYRLGRRAKVLPEGLFLPAKPGQRKAGCDGDGTFRLGAPLLDFFGDGRKGQQVVVLVLYLVSQDRLSARPAHEKLPAILQCVLQGVWFVGIGGDTGWKRKTPGFDGVVAMVDADVHGFAHPFLAVVENLVSCWLRAKRILFFPSW